LKSILRPFFITLLIGFHPVLVKADVIVIANDSVKLNAISPTSLNRIYAMQIKTWPDGTPIKVFTFHTHSKTYKDFVLNQAHLQPPQLERHWKRLLFTGMGKAPVEVSNNEEMIEFVKSTPGAIGYVTEAFHLDDAKILEVEKNDKQNSPSAFLINFGHALNREGVAIG